MDHDKMKDSIENMKHFQVDYKLQLAVLTMMVENLISH